MTKKIILLFFILATLSNFGAAQQDKQSLQLGEFIQTLFCSGLDEEKVPEFKKLLKESSWIYAEINLPKDLELEFSTFLTLEKPGVLALFGPNGLILFKYLKSLAKFLNSHIDSFSFSHFRKSYLDQLIGNEDTNTYPQDDLELLAEIVEFGTKNGFNFEPAQLNNGRILNDLRLPDNLPKEIASRIINCLPHLINVQDMWGYTPLMDAANRKRLDLAKLLIAAKTNLDTKTTKDFGAIPEGMTALDIAVFNNDLDLIKLLLHSGADYQEKISKRNSEISLMVSEFKAEQKQIINSALHYELPQVLVNLVYEYFRKESKES